MKLAMYDLRTLWVVGLAIVSLMVVTVACQVQEEPPAMLTPAASLSPTPVATHSSAPTPTMMRGQGDRAVLESFYRSTNGDQWANNSRWLSNLPVDMWHGVTTDEEGRVTAIRLAGNKLGGGIPANITELDQLVHLNLRGNNLTGELPTNLQQLGRLETFDVSHNKLSGPVPVELAAISSLRAVRIDINGFTGTLPTPFLHADFETSYDHYLNPSAPDCACLAESISQEATPAPDLTWENPYAGIPAPLVALYAATDGDNWQDRTNWLTDLPLEEWYGITTDDQGNVISIDLKNNNLSGNIPPELGDLPTLRFLDLGINPLSGTLPASLSGLTEIEDLRIFGTQVTGEIPPQLGELANLHTLFLYRNQLKGPIPPELGKLVNLTRLALDVNDISGPIPDSLGNLTRLELIHLAETKLSGEFPRALGEIPNPRSVLLFETQLTGCVPSHWRETNRRPDEQTGLPYCGQ